jgi:lipoprotein NlpD
VWQRLRVWWISGSCALLVAACGTQPIAPGTYVVKAGDTLYSIAWRHGLDVPELVRLNNISKDARIYPGQVLRLSKALRPPKQVSSAPLPTRPVTPPATGIKWNWPAVSANYAETTRPNGGVGLVINGQLGQDVKAAAAGRVVYTGTGLLGYGQLIIIKHDDVYLSAYGHIQSVLVHENDQVTRGQPIATMGNGPSGTPMLYFEIRVNGQPTNPLLLLQAQK